MNEWQRKIWECRCGAWNSPGLTKCGKCGSAKGVSCPGPGGGSDTIAEHAEQNALVEAARSEGAIFAHDERLVVTIERHGPRELDYDNFVGGCKQLRDAIAEAMGRKGDAERDGLEFRYVQKTAPKIHKKTIIIIRHAT